MTKAQRDIRRKLGILTYAKEVGNISKTCCYFGIFACLHRRSRIRLLQGSFRYDYGYNTSLALESLESL
jgi:hypothetical protein